MSSIRRRQTASRETANQTKQDKRANNFEKNNNLRQKILLFTFIVAVFLIVVKVYYFKPGLNDPNQLFSPTLDLTKLVQWGSLKSGHYFSIKTRQPDSSAFGFLWFPNRVENNNVYIRHWCDQQHKLSKYTWLKHDFYSFGIQEIIDQEFNLTTSYIVHNNHSWTSRIRVDPLNYYQSNSSATSAPKNKIGDISLVAYFGFESEDQNNQFNSINSSDFDLSKPFELHGYSDQFNNNFSLRIKPISNLKNILFRNHLITRSDFPILKVQQTLYDNFFLTRYPGYESNPNKYLITIQDRKQMKGELTTPLQKANLIINQIIAKPPFEFEIQFTSTEDNDFNPEIDYERLLNDRIITFNQKFENQFKIQSKNYTSDQVQFAQSLLSNMIGSVGQFHGFSKVHFYDKKDNLLKSQVDKNKKRTDLTTKLYGPLSLLTAVPSRSFFPRGFLWDEGFHQLLISRFDRELSKEIIESWFSLMNVQGWIPREVILGKEAEARVPEEFIVQNNLNANPPTFFLTLNAFLNDIESSNITAEKDHVFLANLFPKLQLWYDWLNASQTGDQPGSYRWRGRNAMIETELNVKTLTSGLDDYPRATIPTNNERHIDLLSWMILATKSMRRIAQIVAPNQKPKYEQYEQFLIQNDFLNKLYWSDKYQMYCDWGMHSANVKLVRTTKDGPKVRKLLSPASYQCVDEFGYISLFPFFLRLLPVSSPKINLLLDKMSNESVLWTDFGLRSLSKQSKYYGVYNTEHDPPYWRGAIWINMNYLALGALKYYSENEGPAQLQSRLLYLKLKNIIIENLYKEYKRTGYIWEQYDDKTGVGKGSHPFTGWSALVVLIMADLY